VPAAAPVVALLDAAAPARPTIADRLVFGPDFDNNLWLLRLPDTTPTPLTRLGPLEFSSNPAWSPDGKHLVFSYYRLPGGDAIPVPDGSDLYVMNADGGGLRPLAVHDVPGAALQYPAWAPDGSAVYVSYVRQGGGALAIDRVDVRSGARTRVVPNAGFPSLSRDGRRLAYVQSAVAPARGQSLWWSAPDGSHTQPVVAASVFDKLFGVRLAPDGKRLLFAAVGQPTASPPTLGFLRPLLGPAPAHANGDLWDLWIVDVDGRNLHPVTALSEDLPIAAWSPDGGSIAFLGGGSARSGEAGLTLIGADGAGLRRLTSQPGHRGVDWAPTLAPVARAR
jgi:dipeptidyl aminopeptidase/acylaminoacyl peptidase